MKHYGKSSRLLSSIIAVFLVLSSSLVLAADEKPSGTVEISMGSVAAGVGVSWGKGTLNYNGKQVAFKVNGLSVGTVGISNATSTGKVYHLNKLEDFNGNYASVAAGAAVGGGPSAMSMKNQNGVVIELISTTQGVSFTLGTGGVDIKLE